MIATYNTIISKIRIFDEDEAYIIMSTTIGEIILGEIRLVQYSNSRRLLMKDIFMVNEKIIEDNKNTLSPRSSIKNNTWEDFFLEEAKRIPQFLWERVGR